MTKTSNKSIPGFVAGVRDRIVDARPDELRAVGLAFAYFFLVLTSYSILRPIRDEMGVAGGVENLPWLFSLTLAAMLIANALFSTLVTRYARRRFIPFAYRFFIANLIIYFLLLRGLPAEQQVWVGRTFFSWVSVFNLFVLSVFWAFMADTFSTEQGKRLFGFISVGGTLGAIAGASITALLAKTLGPVNLLLVSAALLEVAAQLVRFFPTSFKTEPESETRKQRAESPIGGSFWSGLTHSLRSPYLLGICAYMLLQTVTATFLYFQQAEVASRHFSDRASRTAFFAQIDVWVNVLTVLVQIFLTSRLLKWLGVGVTLATLPAISIVGFTTLGLMPTIAVLVVYQVLRRAGNFAVSRPAREVLFTSISREDKYKAKSFIDTFVYRAGDQVGAWSYAALGWFGLTMTGISFVAVPLAVIWCFLSVWLGRKQVALLHAQERHS
ncbi:MAG: MFS transporter [Verrucomicrobiota bacterium]|nr:MFS transporter [Verrucomicrobiota bacterium]